MGYMENIAYFENDNRIEKTNNCEHIFTFSKPFCFDYDGYCSHFHIVDITFFKYCSELLRVQMCKIYKEIGIYI